MRVRSTLFIPVFIACCLCFSGAEARAQSSNPAQAWRSISAVQRANILAPHSMSGRYDFAYRGGSGQLRYYEVDFAYEDGSFVSPGTFDGKSYQRVVTYTEMSPEKHTREHATLGGQQAEVRARTGGNNVRVGAEGVGVQRLSCALPQMEAQQGMLLKLADPERFRLLGVDRRGGGGEDAELLFVATNTDEYVRLTCEASRAFMPSLIEVFESDPRGAVEPAPIQTVRCDYEGVPDGTGGFVFVPMRGEVRGVIDDKEVLVAKWTIEPDSLSINQDIENSRFVLEPKETEALVRAHDGRVIQPSTVKPTPAAFGNAPPVHATPYDATPWFRSGSAFLLYGAALAIGAAFWFKFRRK